MDAAVSLRGNAVYLGSYPFSIELRAGVQLRDSLGVYAQRTGSWLLVFNLASPVLRGAVWFDSTPVPWFSAGVGVSSGSFLGNAPILGVSSAPS